MEKTIVQDNEFAESSFIEEYKLAQIVWKKPGVTSEIYRETFLKLLDYVKNVDGRHFISDSRLQGVINPADRKWFTDFAVKKAVETGLVRAAVINKKDPFKKYYINIILKFVTRKTNLDMKVFYDYDEGLKWLLSSGEHLK